LLQERKIFISGKTKKDKRDESLAFLKLNRARTIREHQPATGRDQRLCLIFP